MGNGATKNIKENAEQADAIVTNTDALDAKYGGQRKAISRADEEAALLGILELEKGGDLKIAAQNKEQEKFLSGIAGGKTDAQRANESKAKGKGGKGGRGGNKGGAKGKYDGRNARKRQSIVRPPSEIQDWRQKVLKAKMNTAMVMNVAQAIDTDKAGDEHASFISGLPFVIMKCLGEERTTKMAKAAEKMIEADKVFREAQKDADVKQSARDNESRAVARRAEAAEQGEPRSGPSTPTKAAAAKNNAGGGTNLNKNKPLGPIGAPAKKGGALAGAGPPQKKGGPKLEPVKPTQEELDQQLQEAKAKLEEAKTNRDASRKDSVGMMRAYCSQANSAPIADTKWAAPQVKDARAFSRGPDAAHFREKVVEMFKAGQICIMIFAASRGVKTPGDTGDYIPLWNTCPWSLYDTFSAETQASVGMKNQMRICNLPFGPRMLTQLVSVVKEVAGEDAVARLKVIVVVSTENSQSIAMDLRQRSFYGMLPAHVMLVEQPYIPGFRWDQTVKEFKAAKGADVERKPLGTGYAVQLMTFIGDGYLVSEADDATETITHVKISVFDYMIKLGVTWLTVNMLNDMYRYTHECVIDLDAFALTLKLREDTKCHMSMEVEEVDSIGDARRQQSVCLRNMSGGGPHPASYCEEIEWDSFGSAHLQDMIMQIKKGNNNKLHTCSDRYHIFLPQGNKILRDSRQGNAFTPILKVTDEGMLYPVFDIADLTGHLHCVAITSSAPVSELKTASDLTQMVRIIGSQDRNRKFIDAVNSLPRSKLNPVCLDSTGVQVRLCIMICVSESKSSHAAFKLMQPLLKRGVDHLHLVTFVAEMNEMSQAYKRLESFVPDDLFVETKRTVLLMEGDKADMKQDIDAYASKIKATIVVIGSNALGLGKPKVGSLTARYMNQGLHHTTLYVNEAQQLDTAWEEIECAGAVTFNSQSMMRLVQKMLRPSLDAMTVIRVLPNETHNSEPDTSLLNAARDQMFGIGIQCWAEMKMGKTTKKILEVVQQRKSELLCVQMPDGLGCPDGIKYLFENCPCALLCFKADKAATTLL